jgi:hypothetical protein
VLYTNGGLGERHGSNRGFEAYALDDAQGKRVRTRSWEPSEPADVKGSDPLTLLAAAALAQAPHHVIVSLDGEPTPSADVLTSLLAARRPGEEVPVVLVRRGQADGGLRDAWVSSLAGEGTLPGMTLPIRPLDRTDMDITTVGFGAWAIGGGDWAFGWGPQDDADSLAAIRHAVERGVNWVDTAAVYGLGHSEEVVGRALRELPEDERPLVFTKCGLVWD